MTVTACVLVGLVTVFVIGLRWWLGRRFDVKPYDWPRWAHRANLAIRAYLGFTVR